MKKKKTIRNLISQSEYARLRGVSRQIISKHVQNGMITLVGGKIDPVLADQQLRDNLDPAREHLLKIQGF